VIELPDATHFCFIDRKDAVVQAMRPFLLNQADVVQHSTFAPVAA